MSTRWTFTIEVEIEVETDLYTDAISELEERLSQDGLTVTYRSDDEDGSSTIEYGHAVLS